MRMRRASGWALAAGGTLALTGCGGEAERTNRERPPVPINVTAAIVDGRLLLSPSFVGAGPIRLIISNQSRATQSVTLETAEVRSRPGITRTTAPIPPRTTATLSADVARGAYAVHTRGRRIARAELRVGRRRPSAQGDLLLP
jgi:hypothetical protein